MKRMLLLLSMVVVSLAVGATARPALGANIGHQLFVAPDGQGDQCTQAQPCALATALTKLQEGDSLYLAAGRYTADANAHAVIAITVNDVAVRGGWNGAATGPVMTNPSLHPTLIDGQNQRRGLFIDGASEVSLSGLRIIHGNASGLGSDWGFFDAGGGLYARGAADLTIANCIFQDNVASASRYGFGGGLALYRSDARLHDVQVLANRASRAPAGYGYGGGIYVRQSNHIAMARVQIQGNVASQHAWGYGGGMLISRSSGAIEDAVIVDNIATLEGAGFGGGLAIDSAPHGLALRHSLIQDNLAGGGHRGEGGGIYITNEAVATLSDNRIVRNTAANRGRFLGGGVAVLLDSQVHLAGNYIAENDLCAACPPQSDHAGGVEISESEAELRANVIAANDAAGVLLGPDVSAALTNNLLARNIQAGLVLAGQEGHPAQSEALYNTIADNGSAGILLTQFAALQMTNSLVTGHIHDAGIRSQDAGNRIDAAATLFYDNAIDKAGPGAWTSVQEITGQDPRYLAPGAGDYHLRADSPAIDTGINIADVTEDIDGEARPHGPGVDIGADEYWPMAHRLRLPLICAE